MGVSRTVIHKVGDNTWAEARSQLNFRGLQKVGCHHLELSVGIWNLALGDPFLVFIVMGSGELLLCLLDVFILASFFLFFYCQCIHCFIIYNIASIDLVQVPQKRMSPNQRNRNITRRKKKRKKANQRKENIIKKERKKGKRRKVPHLLRVHIHLVTEKHT